MSTSPAAAREPLQFAYWVPNVSGGLVISDIEQRTGWDYDYNKRLAQTAEQNGFDYALTQVRYTASYGAAFQHEATSFSLALLLATERLKVISAVHPYMWHPGVLAKFIATADHLSNGRAAINVVSGWFKDEATSMGVRWLEHGERYRMAEEFIAYMREIWSRDGAELHGEFFQLRDFAMNPKPLDLPGRPLPEIFQGGNSGVAQAMAGRVSDWYFANGNTPDGIAEQVEGVAASAAAAGRTVKIGVNGFMVARDTEAEAHATLEEIIAKANPEAVRGFGDAVKQAGQSTGDKKGMWQDSDFRDLVQYNDGFRTGLVGTPEQVAHRMLEFKRRGVDLFLLGFLHFQEEVEHFGREVLPIVRELEAAEREDAA
ncbi:dimethylsulfone monooxygenase SfnG [Nocardioides okcheonensis]|uniref:dimethylsulfone monooxygenase SfnG n=1 Tax=Nocardioides okcheonensis TaxID=2894081 RepID=UPI001E4412BD|nr:dimethyl sulfone monooxygenase SfnG [Nocardioides okcheonensis]UFN46357.1 dimethyl sulfone monooxygenase SfnG [Nocardioides okcheonensis]